MSDTKVRGSGKVTTQQAPDVAAIQEKLDAAMAGGSVEGDNRWWVDALTKCLTYIATLEADDFDPNIVVQMPSRPIITKLVDERKLFAAEARIPELERTPPATREQLRREPNVSIAAGTPPASDETTQLREQLQSFCSYISDPYVREQARAEHATKVALEALGLADRLRGERDDWRACAEQYQRERDKARAEANNETRDETLACEHAKRTPVASDDATALADIIERNSNDCGSYDDFEALVIIAQRAFTAAHGNKMPPPASDETTQLREQARAALQTYDGGAIFDLVHRACDLADRLRAERDSADFEWQTRWDAHCARHAENGTRRGRRGKRPVPRGAWTR